MARLVGFGSLAFALCAITVATVAPGLAQSPDLRIPQLPEAKKAVAQVRPVEKKGVKVLEKAGSAPSNTGSGAPATAGAGNEVVKFQGWAVTCVPANANAGARCIAKMNILKSNQDPRPILLISVLKAGNGATLVLQTPTSVELKPGVNLQIGPSAVKHLDYSSCEPALCTATLAVDDILANELGTSPKATASWTSLGVGEVRVEFALQEARNVLAFLASR